jgi:hypothetical protein
MTEYDPAFVDRVASVKREVTERLLALPGVNLVGIGGKKTGGRPTGELVIQVWVDEKLPLSQLPPEQRIPAEIDGVKTDVYVGGGRIRLLAHGAKDLDNTDNARHRKPGIPGGCRIKSEAGDGLGTMGCFLHDPADANIAYGLTCQHVIDAANEPPPTPGTTEVGQPTACSSSSCCDDIIGTYSGGKKVEVTEPDGRVVTVRDEALVALLPGTKFVFDILDIGYISGQYNVTGPDAAARFPVRKRGHRTRLTGGVVITVEATGSEADNAMIIEPNPADVEVAGDVVFFAAEGDSGAALVDDAAVGSCRVTGLVYARDGTRAELQAEGKTPPPLPPDGIERINAYALPIANVIARFKNPQNENIHVVVPQATAAGQVHTVPGGSIAAVPAEVAQRIAAEPAGLAGFIGDVAPDGGLRAPVGRAWFAEGRPREADLLALRERLEATAPGRLLIGTWLAHQDELGRLIRTDRRVTLTWHRGGGAAIAQLFVRMIGRPDLALPETVNGRPVLDAADELIAVISVRGSPALRDDLAWVRRVMPDPAGRTLDEILFALGAPRQAVGSDG